MARTMKLCLAATPAPDTARDLSVTPMREEITAYKRERILEEAVKLFYERGFSGTTLDDIAGKLGVTKPFIYTHFRSKVELLEAICRPTIEMSLEAIIQAVQQPGSPPERLFAGIVDFSKVVL